MTIQGTRRDILVERVKKKKAGTPKPPQMNLASLDAKTAAALISSTADITLVMDGEGTIAEVAFGSEDLEKAIEAFIKVGKELNDIKYCVFKYTL